MTDQVNVLRYARHLSLPEIGIDGQRRIQKASVLLVGVGGLGSPLALYLAASGVGRLGIVDFDEVEESNLQRQILHGTSSINRSKIESAKQRIEDLNPNVKVECHETRLTSKNAMEILADYDVVADGADNFPTRFLVNDACVLLQKPLVSGSILGFEAQLSTFIHDEAPCYRCLYPEPPPPGEVPSCAEAGVLGVLPGVIGTLQATEVLKLILKAGESLSGRLLVYDALAMNFREFKIPKRSSCAICGTHPTIHTLSEIEYSCAHPEQTVEEITPLEIDSRVLKTAHLIDVREDYERDICKLDGSLHVPLGVLNEKELPFERDEPLIVYCKSGGRSSQAVVKLSALGYTNVRNLKGGILRWIDEVNPNLQRY